MGHLIRTRAQAALEMAAALDRGEHLGMLVDQHFSRGVDVMFFGRRCKANPTVARLARQFDCPVVGVRVIRLPDRRFRILAEGPFALPRDAAGQVDVAATTQMITGVVERWVPRAPRAMAVVPSPMAVTVPAVQHFVIAQRCRVPQLWQGAAAYAEGQPISQQGKPRPCAPCF